MTGILIAAIALKWHRQLLLNSSLTGELRNWCLEEWQGALAPQAKEGSYPWQLHEQEPPL